MSTAAAAAGPLLYDAYVSHCEADRPWVEQELVPRLEQAGRRIVLDQDLSPGGLEIEERSRAVAASRKTLLVLSHSFLDDGWPLLEEAVTRELDPAARKRRLVPVLRSDCEVPLRVRPLVAVDLRGGGSPRQWQRLVEALDPQAPEERVSLTQRLSLRLAEATSELGPPSWHGVGAAMMLLVYLTLAAGAVLGYLLAWKVPPLRNALALVLVAPSHALAALVWREDRDLFRRLSHLLGRSRGGRGTVALLAAAVTLAWWSVGRPAVREIACELGCKEPGSTYLAITALDASAQDFPGKEGWRRTQQYLEWKLSAVPNLKVIGQLPRSAAAAARRQLQPDYTIRGTVEREAGPVLTAVLYDYQEVLVPPPLRVRTDPLEETAPSAEGYGEIQALQDRLVSELLERLGVHLTAETAARLARIPTDQPRALKLNDEAVRLQRAGRLEEAEARLRVALKLDPEFSVAWSNLAEGAWRRGRSEEALKYRRRAVELLPAYAPFRYNLGHLLAYLGRNQEALVQLQKALALDPTHVSSYNEMGNVLLGLGEPRQAAAALRRGLLLDPGFAPLSKNLGRALLAGGEAEPAAAPLEQSLTLYPPADWLGQAEAHSLLVEAYAQSKRAADACRHLAELRRLDPGGVAPWTPAAEQAAAGLSCTGTNRKENLHA